MLKRLANHPLPVIFLTVFVDLIGFGILIPVIPLLLANPRSPYYILAGKMSVSDGYILLGFLTAIFPLMQFLATPILGQLSDKFGRKKLLGISLLGTCISYILFAIGIITKNITLLFIARGFDGITGGNIAVAQAAVADVSKPEDRAKNFGLIGAAFGLGFILGPYLGGKLSDPKVVSWFSASIPFWFAAILSFLNVLSVIFIFPETLKEKNDKLIITWNKSIKNIIKAFSFEDLRTIFATQFLFQGGFAFFVGFFSIFLIQRFNFTQGNIGDFFSYVGLWIVFTQAVITRNAAKKFMEFQILRITLIGSGTFILLFFLPHIWWQLLLIVPFFAICNGLSQANLAALVSRSVGPEVQGEILGINASVQALAQSMPPMLSGYIAATLNPSAPVLVASIVIILAGAVFNILYQPTKQIDKLTYM